MTSAVGGSDPLQGHSLPTSTEQGGAVRVLNAISNLTVQRTIVEAFVKLVVCRKVTVQRVAAGSGHVLDSHTTQEEDLPVILDVHRHEVGDICSALGSNPKPATPSHFQQTHSSGLATTPAQCRPTNPDEDTATKRHCFSTADATCRSGNRISHVTGDKNTADCVKECNGATGCRQGNSRPRSVDSSLQRCSRAENSCPQQAQSVFCENVQTKIKETGQLSCSGKNGEDQSPSVRKKRKIDDHDAVTTRKINEVEDEGVARRKNIQVAVSENVSKPDSDEVLREENSNRNSACELMQTDSATKPDKNEAVVIPSDNTKRNDKTVPECEKNHMSAEEHIIPENESLENKVACKITHDNAQATEHPESLQSETEQLMDEGDGEGRPQKRCEDVKNWDTTQEDTKVESDKKLTSDGEADGSGHEGNVVTVFVDGEGNVSVPGESSQQGASHDVRKEVEDADSIADFDSAIEDELVSADSERSEHDEQPKKPPASSDSHVQQRSKSPEKCSDVRLGTNSKGSHSAGPEDDTELDMLVIDLSSSVPGHTGQTAEDDACSSASEQDSQGPEKLDPFAHLFETSFPPLDRTHDNAKHSPAKDSETEPGMSRSSSSSSSKKQTPPVAVVVKDEPDDDCMITAAFISPAQRKGPRLVSHTATSQRRSVPGTVSGGIGGSRFGAAAQRRSDVDQGSWDSSSTTQQFQHSDSMDSGLYQTTASHTNVTVLPSGSQAASPAYVPNFLASTSQPGEHLPAEATTSQPVEGLTPIDYSQRTYQCMLCSKIFLHRRKFDMHLLICGGQRPFKCKICQKGFNQRAHLDTHMKFHIGIKRHRCDLCRKAYVMKGDLIRHLKTRVHRLAMQSQGLAMQSQGLQAL